MGMIPTMQETQGLVTLEHNLGTTVTNNKMITDMATTTKKNKMIAMDKRVLKKMGKSYLENPHSCFQWRAFHQLWVFNCAETSSGYLEVQFQYEFKDHYWSHTVACLKNPNWFHWA